MSNSQFQSNFSTLSQEEKEFKFSPITVSSAQTTAGKMNYDTTPTPSFKPINTSNNNASTNYYEANEKNATSANEIDDEIQQRHMQLLFDKKRKRRESHNAVERRRRDNINERIFELSTLLPERDASKHNKGTILRKSVDHIKLLHEKVSQYQQRIQELENMLEIYRLRWGDLNTNNSNTTSNMDLAHLYQQRDS